MSIKPPVGDVSFLFTDIVGSTDKWEQHGDAFLPILQAHNAILSDAIQRYNGYIVKTEGDSFMVAFADPQDAMRCSILAQAALQRYPWPQDVGNIEVRMAVHTGTPFMQGGDYFGPPVNRTARILSAANGGQVLISDDTINSVKGIVEPGVRFIDQGFHRLKDLDEPIRLHQLSHPKLDQRAYPAPSSLNSVPNNLPMQRRSFVGREKEIEQIASLFASGDTRLLTITGPEGSGKTRLGQQAAAEHNYLFPEGLFIVDIGKAHDLESAAFEVAKAVGCDIPDGSFALTTIQTWLADRRCLLILDDASKLPQADKFIREILSGSAHLRCVATSRESLSIEEAAEVTVPVLTSPPENSSAEQLLRSEAGRLFVDRVVEQRPEFDLSDHRAKTIGRLTRLLPFPGAIEKAVEVFRTDPKHLESFAKDLAVKATAIGHDAVNWSKNALGITPERVELWRSQAESLAASGNSDDAEALYIDALRYYREQNDKLKIALTLHKLGKLAFDRRQYDRAVTLLDASLSTFHEIKNSGALFVRIELENARRAQGNSLSGMSLDQALSIAE